MCSASRWTIDMPGQRLLAAVAAAARSWRKPPGQAIGEKSGMAEDSWADRPMQLIETMRWQSETGYWLLDRHLARLEASAAHFGFACDRGAVQAELGAL